MDHPSIRSVATEEPKRDPEYDDRIQNKDRGRVGCTSSQYFHRYRYISLTCVHASCMSQAWDAAHVAVPSLPDPNRDVHWPTRAFPLLLSLLPHHLFGNLPLQLNELLGGKRQSCGSLSAAPLSLSSFFLYHSSSRDQLPPSGSIVPIALPTYITRASPSPLSHPLRFLELRHSLLIF